MRKVKLQVDELAVAIAASGAFEIYGEADGEGNATATLDNNGSVLVSAVAVVMFFITVLL